MFPWSVVAARGGNSVTTKNRYVEILSFLHFMKYVVFTGDGEKWRNKHIKNTIEVSV